MKLTRPAIATTIAITPMAMPALAPGLISGDTGRVAADEVAAATVTEVVPVVGALVILGVDATAALVVVEIVEDDVEDATKLYQ